MTEGQQQQIREATGKTIAELNIDLTATGRLTDAELDQAAGGVIYMKYLGID